MRLKASAVMRRKLKNLGSNAKPAHYHFQSLSRLSPEERTVTYVGPSLTQNNSARVQTNTKELQRRPQLLKAKPSRYPDIGQT
jgi:hypothetical protein